jgi:drug/metabolite transporter (DMT)-like permease
VPAFALVYGAVFLDETITASAVGGLALVLAGTTLASGVTRLRRSGTPAPAASTHE